MYNQYNAKAAPPAAQEYCGEEVVECRTNIISNQIDNALKNIEMLTCMVRDRADTLLGNEPEAKLGRDDGNLKAIDRGAMDRIQRQMGEVASKLDGLEFQIRRLNRL